MPRNGIRILHVTCCIKRADGLWTGTPQRGAGGYILFFMLYHSCFGSDTVGLWLFTEGNMAELVNPLQQLQLEDRDPDWERKERKRFQQNRSEQVEQKKKRRYEEDKLFAEKARKEVEEMEESIKKQKEMIEIQSQSRADKGAGKLSVLGDDDRECKCCDKDKEECICPRALKDAIKGRFDDCFFTNAQGHQSRLLQYGIAISHKYRRLGGESNREILVVPGCVILSLGIIL